MDITGPHTAYIDNYRSAPADMTNNAAGGAEDFAALLKRTAAADTGKADGTTGARGKFAVIDKTGKLYEQCLELETFLVKNLIGSMRNTVQKSGLIDEGFAGKMYEDMLYDEYAKDFAKNANFGLAEQAYLELTGQRGKVIV
jgi:flagellar protein FlgJ